NGVWDSFRVETSNDGGANWTTLEAVGLSTGAITGSWVAKSFPIVGGTNQFRVRFTVNDNATNSTTVEGAVDGVKLTKLICAQPCAPDVTGNGQVDIDDLLAVINGWGACGVPCPADVNHSGQVDIDDVLAVINGWGACP